MRFVDRYHRPYHGSRAERRFSPSLPWKNERVERGRNVREGHDARTSSSSLSWTFYTRRPYASNWPSSFLASRAFRGRESGWEGRLFLFSPSRPDLTRLRCDASPSSARTRLPRSQLDGRGRRGLVGAEKGGRESTGWIAPKCKRVLQGRCPDIRETLLQVPKNGRETTEKRGW